MKLDEHANSHSSMTNPGPLSGKNLTLPMAFWINTLHAVEIFCAS